MWKVALDHVQWRTSSNASTIEPDVTLETGRVNDLQKDVTSQQGSRSMTLIDRQNNFICRIVRLVSYQLFCLIN
jgi:hypothetical protein